VAEAVIDFTVIIPTFNREVYLADAIASAHAQKGVSLEVIVVNDGGRLSRDPDNCILMYNEGQGAVAARNLGLSIAKGSFIAFVDDDDYWTDPHHLARSRAAFGAGYDLTFADGTLKYVDGRPDRKFAEPADAQSLRLNNTILMSSVCYRRALHDRLGNFDHALPYYYDWDWFLRVTSLGYRMLRHPEPVVAIRVHPTSDSAAANQQVRENNLDLLCKKHGLGKLPVKSHADFASS
jgi:glycosyltransferase involved in cell wall biosynthesis